MFISTLISRGKKILVFEKDEFSQKISYSEIL